MVDDDGNIIEEMSNEEDAVEDAKKDAKTLNNIILPFIAAAREDLEVQDEIEGAITTTMTKMKAEDKKQQRKKFEKSNYDNFQQYINNNKFLNKFLNKYKDDEGKEHKYAEDQKWHKERTKLIEEIHTYIKDKYKNIDIGYSDQNLNFGFKVPNKKKSITFCIVEVNLRSHLRMLTYRDPQNNYARPEKLSTRQENNENYNTVKIENFENFKSVSNTVIRSYEIVEKGETLYKDTQIYKDSQKES